MNTTFPTTSDNDLRKRLARIESLLSEVDHFKDPQARDKTRQIIQMLMDFHGAAVERLLERLANTGPTGLAQIDAVAQDELVSSLLLLYGLHPLDFETRVRQALEKCRPYLHSHGGNVELLSFRDGIVRLRLEGSCHGCPSSTATLKQTIEQAIYEKAPDAVSIEVLGLISAAEPEKVDGRFALPILGGT